MKKIRSLAAVLTVLALCSCGAKPVGNTDTAQNKPDGAAQDTTNTDAPQPEGPIGHEGNIELVYAVHYNAAESELAVIDKFNAADNGFTVKVVPMAEMGEEGTTLEMQLTGDFQLIQDIINTDKVDIVSWSSFLNASKMEILENKGAFADLYKFMETDETVNKSTLNERILSLSETDGKLYHLPIWYTVETMIANSKYVGSLKSWNVREFKECWEKASKDGATFNGTATSEYVYYNTLRENLENYIDYDTATVHFDCEEFRDMLEFCSQFPSSGGRKEEHTGLEPVFVAPRTISGFRDAIEFFNDDGETTVIGFPVNNGGSAYFTTENYAVVANKDPERQRGAWEFIKMFADYEYQTDNWVRSYYSPEQDKTYYEEEGHFSINNRVFDEKLKAVMSGEFIPDMYDKLTGEQIMTVPTQSEIDRLLAYLDSVDRINSSLDRSLWLITTEETTAYFAGESSLDRCVDLIQNRASIWISEQS